MAMKRIVSSAKAHLRQNNKGSNIDPWCTPANLYNQSRNTSSKYYSPLFPVSYVTLNKFKASPRTPAASDFRISPLAMPGLTLNAPIATKIVCFSRLLKCLRSLYGKQYEPRPDCFYRSSQFWVLAVCFYT